MDEKLVARLQEVLKKKYGKLRGEQETAIKDGVKLWLGINGGETVLVGNVTIPKLGNRTRVLMPSELPYELKNASSANLETFAGMRVNEDILKYALEIFGSSPDGCWVQDRDGNLERLTWKGQETIVDSLKLHQNEDDVSSEQIEKKKVFCIWGSEKTLGNFPFSQPEKMLVIEPKKIGASFNHSGE